MDFECPSCRTTFQMGPDALRGRATVNCPSCLRIVVVPGGSSVVASNDPNTDAYLEPVPPGETPTSPPGSRASLALPAGKRVSIAILSGRRKGDVIVLDRPSVVVGCEGAGVQIEVPDPEVSRTHAVVECHGPRVLIRDLGSRHGTFVGDRRIQSHELEDQAEFRAGNTRFMLLVTVGD